jgi:hypothetical protein
MKKLFLLFGLTIMSFTVKSQECYTVKNVNNLTKNIDLSSNKYIFGIKQMSEELLEDKIDICLDGFPISINIVSIESPSVGINIGPFMIKKKITTVKTSIFLNDVMYEGEGSAKISVKATFIELRDENLPFEKSVFSSAIKKSLINAVEKM